MKFTQVLEEAKKEYDSSKPITHTLINTGKIHIPKNRLDAFNKKLLKACIDNNENHQIVERMGNFHPLVFDIDIKYKDVIECRQYTDETILKTLNYLWAKISEYFEIQDVQREMWLMEKEKPYPCVTHKSYKYKDGIHIGVPYIHISKRAYRVLCEIIKDEGVITDIFNETCEIKPSNPGSLFDGTFTSWQPYGCSKKDESYYKLTKVFKVDENDVPEKITDAVFNQYYNDSMFITKMMCMLYREKENITYTKPFEDILIKGYKNMPSNTNNEMKEVENDPYAKPSKKVLYRLEGDELTLVKKLVDCLSEERADDYHKWLSVGMCLHNINPSLLEQWDTFSKLADNYKAGECAKKWRSFKKIVNGPKLGKGSLKWWAKNDSPDKYKKILTDSLSEKIDATWKSKFAGPDAHYKVNQVIHAYFEDQFISVNLGDDWYYFNGVRWEKSLKGTKLKECIHNDIWDIYAEYARKLRNDQNEIGADICLDFQKKLLKENYVKTLMDGLSHMFYRKDIMEEFDTDPNLLAFENGVYDLREHVFREGRPEDNITLSTNVLLPINDNDPEDYKLHIPTSPIKLDNLIPLLRNVNNEFYDIYQRDMLTFLEQILPIPELKDYTLRFLGKCISGENRDEGFYIWTGSGGNGKSKLVELMSKCMGDYACNLPVSLLTQKRKASGAANPEMARTRGKRFTVMQEPDVNETLNIGEMKEITGNDKIQARGLYKEPFEFTPQFKLLLMCNDLPKIPSNDDGTWRRIEATPFISRFVSERQVDESQNKYPRDKRLKEKLDMWIVPFIAILLQEWRLYDSEGITIPSMVKDKTNEYRNENNIIGQWIRDQCEEADNITDTDGVTQFAPGSLQNLFDTFKDWFEDQEVDVKQPDKKAFKVELIKWQESSKWGLSVGKNKSDMRVNGCKSTPLFNLKVV